MPQASLNNARFLLAAPDCSRLPPDTGAEVAMAGRSNAGKSRALNKLVAQKALARTSRTPGRTQQMVVFTLDSERRLVDLPGYGYAKVSAQMRERWQQEMDRYLRSRRSLRGVVLVTDIRHAFKPFDQQMLAFCADAGLACHVLLTKADKLSRNQAAKSLQAARKSCKENGWPATLQVFSAHDGSGVGEARRAVAALLDA